MPLSTSLSRCFRGSVALVSLSGFTFAMILALLISTRSGQEAVANEATMNEVTTEVQVLKYLLVSAAWPLRLLSAIISSEKTPVGVRLASVARNPAFPLSPGISTTKRISYVTDDQRADWEALQTTIMSTKVSILGETGLPAPSAGQYYVETDSLSYMPTMYRDWSQTPIQTCVHKLASQGDQFDVMTIEGVETDNSLVVVHCLRLSLNGTDSGAPEYLISTHSVGAILVYLMEFADAKRAGTYVRVSSYALPEAGPVEFGQTLDDDDVRIALDLHVTPDIRWKVVVVPTGDLIQRASQSLSAKVIGILVGAVVQLLVVVLYFSRSERRRQQYRIALAEFRAIDACMSKTLNAVCHELRNPLHGLQGTLALFLQEHAPQLPPDMQSELSSMWHDIERLEFVLTDVLRMRTMDVENIVPRFAATDVLAVVRDIGNLLRYDVPKHAKLLLFLDKSINQDGKRSIITDSRLLGQMIRITVEHAALNCEPGYVVLHVDHFVSQGDASTWLLFEVWFQRKAESRNRKNHLGSRKLSAPVTPIPMEIVSGISGVTLRKQLESVDSCKRFPETHDIVEVSRLEMDSTERSVTSEELKLARSVSQGGPDITATAGAASKLGGYSGFHSDVAPLDVACVLPKKVDNTPRKRRRFSFGKVGVEDTVVHPGVQVVWERYWYAIPCAPGGSLERRLELLDEGTLQNATKLSAVSDLSNSVVTGDVQDEHLVKTAASIPMTQRFSQCVVAGAVTGTGSDSSESGTANSERDSEHVGSHPTTIFPAKSLRLPPIRIEKQPLTAEPVAAPCDSEAPVSPPRDVIVVVDDERTNLRIASKFLTAVGVDSVQFLDGAELPPALGANVIGIFLDIVMKRSDGVQVCKALRQSGVNVPVLAMTSNVTCENIAAFKAAKFNGIIGKPFKLADVRSAVEYCRKYRYPSEPENDGEISTVLRHASSSTTIANGRSDRASASRNRTSHVEASSVRAQLQLHSISDASGDSEDERDAVCPVTLLQSQPRGHGDPRPWFTNLS